MKKKGCGKVKHKDALTDTDTEILYEFLSNTSNPKSLQRKVFWDLMYYFCRRAMENLRLHTKTTFIVAVNDFNVEYVEIDIILMSGWLKNHGLAGPEYDDGRMYADGTDSCPVTSYKLYLDKLNPSHDALFQRPKTTVPFRGPWFDNQVIGVKTLEKMMKTMSIEAGLSQQYTNHCIRTTCISTEALNKMEMPNPDELIKGGKG